MASFDRGGAEEIRTPDPLVANQMLYQLSYSPVRVLLDPNEDMRTSNLSLQRFAALSLATELQPCVIHCWMTRTAL